MTYAQPNPPPPPALSQRSEEMVMWIRELEECRINGLVTDEDYAYQRAEKFSLILSPMRGLWLASLLGTALLAAPAAAAIWHFTHNPLHAAIAGAAGGLLGLLFLGRMLREKFAEFLIGERRKILVALLETDLLTASEFADYDERLLKGWQNVI